MENLTVETLMNSEYDADMNRIYLQFDVDGKEVVAYGKAPEGSFAHEDWFDHQENIDAFLKDATIEEK